MKILCPAKINHTLKIGKKMPNGLHEIRSEMEMIDLCDELEIKKKSFEENKKAKGLVVPLFEGEAGGDVFRRLPYDKKLTKRAQELRQNMTPAEKKLWYEFLSSHQVRFLRQRPIDHYIVDFYCPEFQLVLEIDGDSHYTEG